MHISIEQTVEKIYFFSKFNMTMAEQALVCGMDEELDGKAEEERAKSISRFFSGKENSFEGF